MATLSLLSTTMLLALHSALDRERASRDAAAVRLLAVAGLHKAGAELAAGNRGYSGEDHTPLGEGDFTVVVRAGSSPYTYRVESTGSITDSGRIIRSTTLTAELRIESNGSVAITDVTQLRIQAAESPEAAP